MNSQSSLACTIEQIKEPLPSDHSVEVILKDDDGKKYSALLRIDRPDREYLKTIRASNLGVTLFCIGNAVAFMECPSLNYIVGFESAYANINGIKIKRSIIKEVSNDETFLKMFDDRKIAERLLMISYTYDGYTILDYEILLCYVGFKYLSAEPDLQKMEDECYSNKAIPGKYKDVLPDWVTPYMFAKSCRLIAMKRQLSDEMFARMLPGIPDMSKQASSKVVRFSMVKLNIDEIHGIMYRFSNQYV